MDSEIKIKSSLKIIKGSFFFIPFINLLFLLFLFFVVTSSFIQFSAIRVDLPDITGQSEYVTRHVVTIDANNLFYLNNVKLSKSELASKLEEISSNADTKGITIRADKNITYETLADVISLAQQLNLNVNLAVSPIDQNVNQIQFENQ